MEKDTKLSRITTVILLLIAVSLCISIIYLLFNGKSTEVKPEMVKEETKTNVYIKEIEESTFTKSIRLYGKVENRNSDINILTQNSGYVTSILVKKGDEVKAGDILGYTDSSNAGSSYKEAPIKARSNGTISEINASIGEYLSSGSVFATIKSEEELYVSIAIPERYVNDVTLGSKAILSSSILPAFEEESTISYIAKEVDNLSGTFKGEINVEDSISLKEGMIVTVDLITSEIDNAFTLPLESVSSDNSSSYVYVVEEEKALKREVTISDFNSSEYLISSGLRKGDEVIVEGSVTDGKSVNVLTRGAE